MGTAPHRTGPRRSSKRTRKAVATVSVKATGSLWQVSTSPPCRPPLNHTGAGPGPLAIERTRCIGAAM